MAIAPDDPDFSFEAHGGFQTTSNATPDYNCIAWAAGRSDKWWWPDAGHKAYWPRGVPRSATVDSFTKAFSLLGYSPCGTDDSFEGGFEKVAIFAKNGVPTHAARQLVAGPHAGSWTSKLGRGIDVAHHLHGAAGVLYGTVILVMRRPVAAGTFP